MCCAFALLPLLQFCFVDDYLLAMLGQLLIQNCFNLIHYLQKTLKSYKSIHGTYKYSTKSMFHVRRRASQKAVEVRVGAKARDWKDELKEEEKDGT